jgi:exonuclease III
MLADFLHRHHIDITLLQEVTCPQVVDIPHYDPLVNIGTDLRGTAILTRTGLLVDEVRRLPSGRGIAVHVKQVWYVSVYAPSGAESRADRDVFF